MKILVVRFKLLGDAVLSSTLCHSLRKSFPDAQIDYVTYAPYSDLFLNHSAISKIYAIDEPTRKSPFKYLKFVRDVASNEYDIVIDAQGTAKSNFFSLFSSKAEFKISCARKRLSSGFTHQVKRPIQGDKVEERLSLLEPLHSKFDLDLTREFSLTLLHDEEVKARAKLEDLGVDFNKPLIAFALSANETYKKWCRLEYFELVAFCKKEYGAQILLFHGLPKEKADVDLFLSEMETTENVFSNFHIESIRCLPALFSQCALFIGNEGGPRHIAHAVGTPTVSIFSPSASKSEWLPANDSLHLGFEWRDIPNHQFDNNEEFEIGDSEYYRRYNAIKADMVKPLIQSVVTHAGGLQ